MAVIPVIKPLGWTPLQAIARLRELKAEFAQSEITYAGRLDPMAEGVLLLLSDADRYRKGEFLTLPKTYAATFLFGYTSDTYDVLGLPEKGGEIDAHRVVEAISSLVGTHMLPFPPYSSYKVKGKPLHWWATEHRLGEIEIPLKEMKVLKADSGWGMEDGVTGQMALEDIEGRIARVEGNFRQQECVEAWQRLLSKAQNVVLARVTLEVASGTYIRSLAHDLGQRLGCGALLFSLTRTKVGDFTLSSSLPL